MIKNYAPQPYDGTTALPQYVTDVSTYTLIGEVPGGYKIHTGRAFRRQFCERGKPAHPRPVQELL